MRVLWLSYDGSGFDMALRLALEGHDVRIAKTIADDIEPDQFEGILPISKDWKKDMLWADLVMTDYGKMMNEKHIILSDHKKTTRGAFGMGHADKYFKFGDLTFHGSGAGEVLEKERGFVHELFETYKVGNKIESQSFDDPAKALDHLRSHKVPHVIKPESGEPGSEMVYVSQMPNGEDGIAWLESLPDRPDGKKIKKVEIEEKKLGVEFAVSCWYNGNRWIGPVNLNMEHKRLLTGELGCLTGEQGTTMAYDQRPIEQVPFFQKSLARLEPILAAFDYRGQMDLNCIVNEEGIWPLELTPRLGYPSSYIEPELQITPFGELFTAIANGSNIKNKVREGWAIGVVLTGLGFPDFEKGRKQCAEMPIFGVAGNLEHLHLCEVKAKKGEGHLRMTGCYPVTATARGLSPDEARRKVYQEVIPKVYFPNMGYRTDIGAKTAENMVKLRKFGWTFQVLASPEGAAQTQSGHPPRPSQPVR